MLTLVFKILRDTAGRIVYIIMPRPSNLHAHFRWDGMIEAVTPAIMTQHKYALSMPNNGPGMGGVVRTVEDARRVYQRIMGVRDEQQITGFTDALMTLYLTSDITPAVIEEMHESRIVRAVKSYPVHAAAQQGTTNSGHGVPFDEIDVATIRAMIEYKVPLLVHAEDVNDLYGRELPHAEREAHCIMHRLRPFREKYPDLLISVEHASTCETVALVKEDKSLRTVLTATPHHLLFVADDFVRLGNLLRNMPYNKKPEDREALFEFVATGDPRCIAGNDTAPHPSRLKIGMPFERATCGCWLPHSIALYARAFAQRGKLDESFVKFMCYNGPDWWGLERPAQDDTIRIVADTVNDIPAPTTLPEMDDIVLPLGWVEQGAMRTLELGFVAHEC